VASTPKELTMDPISPEAILSPESVGAGVQALERVHGRHLRTMTPNEQAEARAHWQEQVEQILAAVHASLIGGPPAGQGRAMILFTDAADETVQVSVHFEPELRELGGDEVEGTPAQVLAVAALEAIEAEAGGPPQD